MAFELNPGLKGYPIVAGAISSDQIGARQWHVLDDAMPYPLATLRTSALMHNLAWMQTWARRKGVQLAPHGKTTMSPELFRLQLQAGAWGMTVANVHQLQLALAAGAQRCIIANQVLADADLDGLDALLTQHAAARVWFLVDSLAQLAMIEDWQRRRGSARRFDVLLELGTPGFRTGCRSHDEALVLARALAASPAARLGGVECYEGGLAQCDSAHDSEAVSALVRRVRSVVQAIDAEGLWGDEQLLITAGGSAIFDLVIPLLTGYPLSRPVQGVLRSGCYVTHDHGRYANFLQLVEQREGLQGSLQAAIEIWAMVQSVPEPGLALLSAGRRDVSFDQRMPLPVRWAARGSRAIQATPAHWEVQALSDQHAHMRFDPAGDSAGICPQVGDRVALGISHPCTTFDKWRWMAFVDDEAHITGAIGTHF
ncbi:MAG: amino acid deaminase [Limnohabitans sp.]|nr:MAG: amino acid deaminase [Limnohabitans sp.]